MKARTLGCVLLGFCLGFIPVGCGSPDRNPRSDRARALKIAVIPKGMTREFWKSIHAGAALAAKELEVEILWDGPLKDNDPAQQTSVVERAIDRRVDGIVLAPLDATALLRPLRIAAKKKIPVVVIDSALPERDYVSFVATDNYLGGVLAARRMGEVLRGRGRIFLVRCLEGSRSTSERERGFLETIEMEYPRLELRVRDRHAGSTEDSAYRLAMNLLEQFRDVEGIFCPNESTTSGTLRALQETDSAGRIKLVGFDSSPRLIQALGEGKVSGLVLQNPIKMGYLGVTEAVHFLRGQTVPARVDTGAYLATRENMDTPEIKVLLSPDLSILD